MRQFHSRQLLFVVTLSVGLVACGGGVKRSTLGDLEYTPKKEEKIEVAKVSHEQVREEYREILNLVEDQQLKEQIERRIADVYMMEGVQDQNHAKPQKSYYIEAIKSYRRILDKYPDSPDNAEVLYQLAKAYDMEGQTDEALAMLTQLTTRHPYYPNLPEAYFRMGDIHFNYQRYAQAEKAYVAVTRSQNPKLHMNAYYMLGWSYYKLFQYDRALDAYSYVITQILAQSADLDTLGKAEKLLVTDTLHSVSLSLDKMGGAEYIPSVQALYKQSYVWMVYENLGSYYLEKELYGESVASYSHYVSHFPNSPKAPEMHSKLIETYIKGGFPRQAIEEKENYVAAYGVRSSYAGNSGGIKKEIYANLKIYLDELAQHHHSEGQLHDKEIAKFDAQEEKGVNPKEIKPKRNKEEKLAKQSYEKAAGFYAQYAETFPKDERIDEIYFLRAEALFAAELFDQAIQDYERVAYRPQGTSAKKHAADAGYAAIISYQKLIAPLPAEGKAAKQWQANAVESMLKFAETFHQDDRSPSVLTNAAEYLFSLDQYDRAIKVSSDLIAKNPALDKTLKKTAYGILAHSYFKLNDFANAENSYVSQRALVDTKSDEYGQISERLGATIYKKSETIIAAGDKQQAVNELLKIKQLTPNSKARVPAQYDAAVMLLEMENWSAAITELKELNAKFSDHELAVEFPRKLAYAYEKNKNWDLAASAYLVLYESDPDEEVKREALFLAASMYEENTNYNTAITHFKRYAHAYEKPFSTRMEARYRLALNYERLEEPGKQLYWLRRIIENDKTAGTARTERSKWLAAWASIKYGDYYGEKFRNYRLRQPIVESISGKNENLGKASGYYQNAAEYGILEFVTMSSFKIAGLYQTFAKDLRAAPAPGGLSSEELGVYAEIIEEQARPFEQLAMELHQANIERAWDGEYNEWIQQSFGQMKVLSPARFDKTELIVSYGDEIR